MHHFSSCFFEGITVVASTFCSLCNIQTVIHQYFHTQSQLLTFTVQNTTSIYCITHIPCKTSSSSDKESDDDDALLVHYFNALFCRIMLFQRRDDWSVLSVSLKSGHSLTFSPLVHVVSSAK